MKRLQIFFLSLFLLTACNNNELPKGIIEEQKMVKVMADLHVIDGYMSSLVYTDTLRTSGKNYYATVYKNHNITRTVYENSLKYYSNQPVLLDSMYSKVERILQAKEKRVIKNQEQKLKKLTQSK